MYILGISCHYHESAAALIKDGAIVAAIAEERLSRKKHDPAFPTLAIAKCLSIAGITTKDLDYVAFYEKPFQKFFRNLSASLAYAPHSRTLFVDGMRNALTEKLWIKSTIVNDLHIPADRVVFVPQHLSHAAASYYPSPFARAAYLTLDAVGEWTTGSWGTAEGIKLFPKQEMRFPHSVGMLYAAFTAFLGFEVNDGEYKVMGMAAYGKPKHADKVRKTFRQFKDGSIALDLSYFLFQQSTTAMYSAKFARLFAGCDKFDLAASVQLVTQEIILTLMKVVAQKTGETNLVYGGGVALNSVINGMVTKKTPFKDIFIFPAAGDDGGSVGAALYLYHHVLGNRKRVPLTRVFLGADYDMKDIGAYLKKEHIKAKLLTEPVLIKTVVDALLAGKVVAWYQGRSEFGPRALGHRTILADPINPQMKDIVNHKIKFREEFRPFAPVVLAERANDYFTVTAPLLAPFMIGTFPARPKAKKIAAAVVHLDMTSRIQTVDKAYPGRYRTLLAAFYKKTKRPILLNTSFNLKGEPIVDSPADAYSTFMRSGIDVLVLDKYVMLKKDV
jgi:carbamoyltransferase